MLVVPLFLAVVDLCQEDISQIFKGFVEVLARMATENVIFVDTDVLEEAGISGFPNSDVESLNWIFFSPESCGYVSGYHGGSCVEEIVFSFLKFTNNFGVRNFLIDFII